MNNDGTVSQVPTKVIQKEGKYYAVVNSLTNSAYAVISCAKVFMDAERHWAKSYINEMGSRLVINGIDKNIFAPDRDITRAEFTAIAVRALGLGRKVKDNQFSDVKESDWYCNAVNAACAYGMVTGCEDGTFKPGRAISRKEAFVIMTHAMKIAGMDINISEYQIPTRRWPVFKMRAALIAGPGIQ